MTFNFINPMAFKFNTVVFKYKVYIYLFILNSFLESLFLVGKLNFR